MASKNAWAKTRDKGQPYAVYQNNSGWTWRVLKAYQNREKERANPYARWFCFVTSPFCPEGEYGDTYVSDIVHASKEISRDARES